MIQVVYLQVKYSELGEFLTQLTNISYNELHLKNPITSNSIDQLFLELGSCDTSLLIINSGDHIFESIDVLRELKLRFMKEETNLNRFRKIAFIHPPEVSNKSENEERYNYFFSREEAIDWLLKGESG